MSKSIWDFIEDLALRRMEKGFSQEKLANKMGYSRYTLMKWEVGERRPRLDTLIDWIESLGGTLIVEWDDDKEKGE